SEHRIAAQQLAVGLEAEERAEQDERRTRRPRLRAARGRVLDRKPGLGPVETGERFGEPAVEGLLALGSIGRLNHFHNLNPEPDPCRDDQDSPEISWPNYHSGSN